MAKTFTSSLPSVASGDVYQATAHNNIVTTLNNHTVPPACHVYRSTNLTSYASGAAITWDSEFYDTDSMFTTGGSTITTSTAGIYLVALKINFAATATVTAVGFRIAQNSTVIAQTYSTSISAGTSTSGGHTYVGSFAANDTISANLTIAGGSAYIIQGGASLSELVSTLSVTFLGKVA